MTNTPIHRHTPAIWTLAAAANATLASIDLHRHEPRQTASSALLAALGAAMARLTAVQNRRDTADHDGRPTRPTRPHRHGELTMTDTTDALNAAYRERAELLGLLAALYPSHVGHTDPDMPDWQVLTIEAPTGQLAWHIAPADQPLFQHVRPTTRIARGWDGHTTEQKYQRIRDLIAGIDAGEYPAVPLAVTTSHDTQTGA